MANYNPLFQNPTIKGKNYFALVKLTEIEQSPDNTYTDIQFRCSPLEDKSVAGKIINSRIYHTDASFKVWQAFLTSFRCKQTDLKASIGNWGSVMLIPSKWKELTFSTVQYIRQTHLTGARIVELQEREQAGNFWSDTANGDNSIMKGETK